MHMSRESVSPIYGSFLKHWFFVSRDGFTIRINVNKTLLILILYVDLLNYPFNYNRESRKEAGIIESTIGGHIVTRIQWALSSGAEVNTG